MRFVTFGWPLTCLPFRKKRKVGVAEILYSRATIPLIPRLMLTSTKAAPSLFFASAISLKTGAIIRQGAQVSEVKNASTALFVCSKELNEATLVEI